MNYELRRVLGGLCASKSYGRISNDVEDGGGWPHSMTRRDAAGAARAVLARAVSRDRYDPIVWIKRPRRLLRSRLGSCLLFHVGVKDRVPFATLHLPDRTGVVVARGIFAVHGALHLDLIGHDCRVRIGHGEFEIAQGERFHVPLFHRIYLLLLRLDSVAVNGHEVGVQKLFEIARLLVLEALPGRFFLRHHRVLVRRGDRDGDRREEGGHCIGDIFFHKSFRFVVEPQA